MLTKKTVTENQNELICVLVKQELTKKEIAQMIDGS